MSIRVLAGTQVMSTLTGAQMETRIRYKLNEETASFWSSAEILGWINDGCQEIAVQTLCLGTSENVTLVADTLEYSLTSTDYIAVVAAVYDSSRGLVSSGPWRVGKTDDVEQPAEFYLWDGKVGIMPVFSTGETPVGKTVRFYLAQAPASIESTDTIPLPAIFDNALQNYVLAQAFRKDERMNWAAGFLQDFNQDMARYRADFFEPSGDVEEAA